MITSDYTVTVNDDSCLDQPRRGRECPRSIKMPTDAIVPQFQSEFREAQTMRLTVYRLLPVVPALLLALVIPVPGRADEPTAQDRSAEPVRPPESAAPESPGLSCDPMTAERMGELIRRIDPRARSEGNTFEFGLESYRVAVIYDEAADRMRIIIPIESTGEIDEKDLMRLMQANFDSALDARYAIARDILWATYIHPLSSLTDAQFLVGVGQTANIVATYGTSYSSGMFIFGGGDSAELERRKLIDRLKELETST